MTSPSDRGVRWITWIGGLASVVVFLGHLVVLRRYAVNVPFSDEWDLFRPGALPDGLRLEWLFATHNEHRIVVTKLLAWLQLRLTGYDFRFSIIASYLCYGVTVAALVACLRAWTPRRVFAGALCFVPFLFSPINWENLVWGFQIHFHLFIGLTAAAALLLFSRHQRPGALLLASALIAVATYTVANGLTAGVVLLICWMAFKLGRAKQAADVVTRRRELLQLGVVGALVLGAAVSWLATYQFRSHGPMALPTQLSFWRHYLNLVSLGFGATQRASALGVVCVGFIFGPAALLVYRNRRNLLADRGLAAVVALLVVLACVQATISLGRGNFGADQAKSSRYAEFGLVLLPLVGAALLWALEGNRAQWVVTGALWLLCFGSFWAEWRVKEYETVRDYRLAGLECVRNYADSDSYSCPHLSPLDIASALRGAKSVNASFLRSSP